MLIFVSPTRTSLPREIAEAGVDMFVAGSAILKEPRTQEAYKATIDEMRAELAKVPFPGKN